MSKSLAKAALARLKAITPEDKKDPSLQEALKEMWAAVKADKESDFSEAFENALKIHKNIE
jgi:hypothetical protein